MKYKDYGLNAEFIATMTAEQWAEYSSKEFGFTAEESVESYSMLPEKEVPVEETTEEGTPITITKRKRK